MSDCSQLKVLPDECDDEPLMTAAGGVNSHSTALGEVVKCEAC